MKKVLLKNDVVAKDSTQYLLENGISDAGSKEKGGRIAEQLSHPWFFFVPVAKIISKEPGRRVIERPLDEIVAGSETKSHKRWLDHYFRAASK